MKVKIFDTVKDAQDWNAQVATAKGCSGSTRYWYSETPISIDTTLTKAEYAELMGIPATLVSDEGVETDNPEYTALAANHIVRKHAVIVNDDLDVTDEETGVTTVPDDVVTIRDCTVIVVAQYKAAANGYVQQFLGYTLENDLFNIELSDDDSTVTHYMSNRLATQAQVDIIGTVLAGDSDYSFHLDTPVDTILASEGLSYV